MGPNLRREARRIVHTGHMTDRGTDAAFHMMWCGRVLKTRVNIILEAEC